MNRVYELFEILAVGPPHRVAVVSGLESAKTRLRDLADDTPNECFAADAETHQIIAQMNVPPKSVSTTGA